MRDKAFNIPKNPKYDEYQRGLDPMVYNFFDKKSTSSNGVANNEIKQNLPLAEELRKPIIRNFKKKNSLFRIWTQYLGWWFSWYAINKQA